MVYDARLGTYSRHLRHVTCKHQPLGSEQSTQSPARVGVARHLLGTREDAMIDDDPAPTSGPRTYSDWLLR